MRPLLFTLLVSASLPAADWSAWSRTQPLPIDKPGLTRVDLPISTLAAALPELRDLRLSDAAGNEVPFALDWPLMEAPREIAATNFMVSQQAASTVLTFDAPDNSILDALSLHTASPDFVKAVTLEAQADADFISLGSNLQLFRLSSGANRLRIALPAKAWKRFRLHVNDSRSAPVAFTGAALHSTEKEPALTTEQATFTAAEAPEPKTSTWRVKLPAVHQWWGELRLRLPEPLFDRAVLVRTADQVIRSRIYRLNLDGQATDEVSVPLHTLVSGDMVELTIIDGDSPPLQLQQIEATRYPVALLFHASAPGEYALHVSNPAATAAQYDLALMLAALRKEPATLATLNALSQPAKLHADAGSVMLDLKGWTQRKALRFAQPGVLSFVLDQEVLSTARPDFADLRLVQNDVAVPYLIERDTITAPVPLTITALPADSTRPKVSLWQLRLPRAGLPLEELTLTSPSPLFQRRIEVSEWITSLHNKSQRRDLASAMWTHRPEAAPVLELRLARPLITDTLELRTDNGDNPAIELATAQVTLRSATIVAKVRSDAPVTLHYGNARASAPSYDLALLANELRLSTKQPATLEAAQVGEAATPPSRPIIPAGPLLWVVLGIVVIGLLIIVVKLLPPAAAP